MKRQKLKPGLLHIAYLFQHQLTFTSGLGNHKKNYLMKKLYELSKDALCFFWYSFLECIACFNETQ